MPKINVRLSTSSIDEAIKQIEEYRKDIERKRQELCKRLAELGAVNVSLMFSRAIYTGENDFEVSTEPSEKGYKILANGETVAFVEFGAGVTYGYGHPKADEVDPKMGPGTYPPTNPNHPHWNDPNGWWLPKKAGGGHTYGNPPNMPMYNTAQDLAREVARVAKEVFSS